MDAIDFLHQENPPTWTGIKCATLGAEGQLQTNYTTQSPRQDVSFLHFLEPGTWYFSIINDDSTSVGISFLPSLASVCPVHCSGNGRYVQGSCRCETGWKGTECNVPVTECEVNDCNNQGICVAGKCKCRPGYKGNHCEGVDCLDPFCAGHGACVNGQCWCKTGWRGVNCSEADNRLSRCFPDCNKHGVYDLESERCICFDHWAGPDCSRAKCGLDCGNNGQCEEGRCRCDSGWSGARCDQKTCDDRCHDHGQCNNGTCVCVQGWMGTHCTLVGCRIRVGGNTQSNMSRHRINKSMNGILRHDPPSLSVSFHSPYSEFDFGRASKWHPIAFRLRHCVSHSDAGSGARIDASIIRCHKQKHDLSMSTTMYHIVRRLPKFMDAGHVLKRNHSEGYGELDNVGGGLIEGETAMANAFWVSVRNNISKRWKTTENDVQYSPANPNTANPNIRLIRTDPRKKFYNFKDENR
ncbi:teneurin-a [Trichonephila clavipes]|nr:teneurin-a [Trichonephila clavipes]